MKKVWLAMLFCGLFVAHGVGMVRLKGFEPLPRASSLKKSLDENLVRLAECVGFGSVKDMREIVIEYEGRLTNKAKCAELLLVLLDTTAEGCFDSRLIDGFRRWLPDWDVEMGDDDCGFYKKLGAFIAIFSAKKEAYTAEDEIVIIALVDVLLRSLEGME
jgi:hypothetical protein